MREIIFEVKEAPEGGYDATAVGHSVFTQGEDWDDLKEMVRDAVLCHFDDREAPKVIRLRGRPSRRPQEFRAGEALRVAQ